MRLFNLAGENHRVPSLYRRPVRRTDVTDTMSGKVFDVLNNSSLV